MIQKSYKESKYGNLYLIPTPIGNIEDITLRALNVLKDVDIIYAEDTRETSKLLKYYDINKPINSCHKYSEMMHKDKIINELKNGKNIGYMTDRGTPLISDPGNVVVSYAIKNNINVISLPGASALLPALNMSGLSNEKFLFYGFLDSKKSIAKNELIELKEIKQTLIFYEAPHRIKETLLLIKEVLGDRNIAIAREISKLYEEIIRDKISNTINQIDEIKGEIVIVVEGYIEEEKQIDYEKEIKQLINKGYSKKDAIHEIADKYNISKNKIYNLYKD